MDTIALRVVARFKTATDAPNPLRSMNRTQVVRHLYKIIGRIPDGFFRDNSWIPVHKVFKVLRDEGVEYEITDTEYRKEC